MTDPEPLSTLTQMRALLSPQGAWAQCWYAFDSEGNRTTASSPDACRWCLRGALNRVADTHYERHAPVVYALAETLGIECEAGLHAQLQAKQEREVNGALYSYNDAPSRTHAEVLALLDATIARLSP